MAPTETLEDFPELGREVPEAEATKNIRELIFQSYIIKSIQPEPIDSVGNLEM